MPEGDGEKTEKATPKRRDEARKKGQVAVSQDLSRAFQLMAAVVTLHFIGFWIFIKISQTIQVHLKDRFFLEMSDSVAVGAFKSAMTTALEILAPFFLTIIVTLLAVNISQVGFKITPETMKLNLGKLNPIKGLKKLVSLRSVMKLTWSIAKVTALALVVYWSLKDRITEIAGLGGCGLFDILRYFFSLLFVILFRVALVLIILAFFDYLYQKWQYEKDLRMTKHEVKEEMKQTIGDPVIKRRIRQAQLKMFKQRMMEKVPEATVVVTNPTHYAVAIKYVRQEMNAPTVVAKGMNLIAEKIKSIARKHNVPLVENKMLAQTLYRTVEVGDEVPPRLYRAVAEVLTYVFRLKGKL